MYATQLTHDW